MIVVLVGRRIDAANAEIARFPAKNEGMVKERIRGLLKSLDATTLVGSAACGVDILAQEVAAELGITRHAVITYDVPTFRSASVTDRPGNWGARYDKVIAGLSSEPNTLIALNLPKDDDDAFAKTNVAILQDALTLAEARGQQSEDAVVAVIVWDGQSRGDGDLTEHFLNLASEHGLRVETVLTLES